jgi:hypothetical protein
MVSTSLKEKPRPIPSAKLKGPKNAHAEGLRKDVFWLSQPSGSRHLSYTATDQHRGSF